MLKNKSYIGISFIILIFGIYAIPKIVNRIQNGNVVKGDRLDSVSNNGTISDKLVVIGPAPKFECPKMNKNLIEVQNQFFGNPNFGIVSITIDPEHDTAEVLKAHAELLGVKSSNWHFLTGDKKYIYDLANKGFNLYAGENSKVNGGFEHSGFFALIDKKGNIRCRKDEYGNPILYYEGIEKEGVRDIKEDIAILLRE